MFGSKKKIDVGQPCANVEIVVTVHREEFMDVAESVLEARKQIVDPCTELKRMAEAIGYARRNLSGNWVITNKNFLRKRDPMEGLEQKSAVLEVDRNNAIQLVLLRDTVASGESFGPNVRGVEIQFSTSFFDYIKYKKGRFYFRDAAIDSKIDEIVETGSDEETIPGDPFDATICGSVKH